MADRWRADDGPLIVEFGSSLVSTLVNLKEKSKLLPPFRSHRERERYIYIYIYIEQAYDVETMSDQRRCDIMTSLRHWYNIVLRLYAH